MQYGGQRDLFSKGSIQVCISHGKAGWGLGGVGGWRGSGVVRVGRGIWASSAITAKHSTAMHSFGQTLFKWDELLLICEGHQ